jgi:actin-related protein 5
MAPSATDETVSQRDAWKNLPPPTVYPVKEAKFEKYLPPQLDGRERALARPEGQAAIVIDNGARRLRSPPRTAELASGDTLANVCHCAL